MSETASTLQRVGVETHSVDVLRRSPRPKADVLRFGIFELDISTSELRKDGRLIHLRLQPVSVLRLLLERAGALVTRREITSALWPDDIDVDVEQGLNHCMKEIRAALGDRPDSPHFIQTLPRRGYRFLIQVQDTRTLTRSSSQQEAQVALDASKKKAADTDDDPDQRLTDGRFE